MKVILSALILSVATQSSFGFEESIAVSAQLLSPHGIEATRDGVEKFLLGLKPDEAFQVKARMLIAQLGAQDFSARDDAVKGLIDLPIVPVSLLREAAASSDSEIAYRAQMVLNDPRTAKKLRSFHRQREVTAAVLRLIRDKPIRETTPLIIEAAPFLDDWELVMAAADAVAVVAKHDEIPLLRESITNENVSVRIAAIRGLGAAAGESAKAELRELCNDSNSSVALAAAHALAAQADRAGSLCTTLFITILRMAGDRTR